MHHAKSLARFRYRHFMELEAGVPVRTVSEHGGSAARAAAREVAKQAFLSRFTTAADYGKEQPGVLLDEDLPVPASTFTDAGAAAVLSSALGAEGAQTPAAPAVAGMLSDAAASVAVVDAGSAGTGFDHESRSRRAGGALGWWRRDGLPSRLRPMLSVNRKKLMDVCNASDSEDEGLVAMCFNGLSGAASLGVDLDEWVH